MILKELIKGLTYINLQGDKNIEVNSIKINSRDIQKDDMYCAINGFNVDGHKFIESAIKKGANLILCEKNIATYKNVTVIQVENTRKALSIIADNFYNSPHKKLSMIGVTGTNGKTSVTYFMEEVLANHNQSTGVIGTIEIRANGKKLDFDFATSTTPDTIELNEILNIMIDKNVKNVVMEVSSHALELHKVDKCKFDIAIFTNLTQDHLDLHLNMENYLRAKSKLFGLSKTAVINIDDNYAKEIMKNIDCNIITYSIENQSDIKAINIQYFMDKVIFDVLIDNKVEKFELNIPGRFSIYNALAVIGASIVKCIPVDIIKKGISNIKGVAGRIQTIHNNKGLNVIVDYAHSPDGLHNIISAVREFTKGKVITIFGCGGDRDKKKRAIMGKISAEFSDYTIVTSDNPRSEVPENIIDDIEIGIKLLSDKYEKITSRREAIFKAINMANKLDTVIIAGKGHENYEVFANETIYFDDAEVAKEALEEL